MDPVSQSVSQSAIEGVATRTFWTDNKQNTNTHMTEERDETVSPTYLPTYLPTHLTLYTYLPQPADAHLSSLKNPFYLSQGYNTNSVLGFTPVTTRSPCFYQQQQHSSCLRRIQHAHANMNFYVYTYLPLFNISQPHTLYLCSNSFKSPV
ncbi:hypothetical protein GE21DRAFT_1121411 [Neurospora crassa]|nr:hypothetical protein GE21DRAFT_1121411 [Neurospora crassa]